MIKYNVRCCHKFWQSKYNLNQIHVICQTSNKLKYIIMHLNTVEESVHKPPFLFYYFSHYVCMLKAISASWLRKNCSSIVVYFTTGQKSISVLTLQLKHFFS